MIFKRKKQSDKEEECRICGLCYHNLVCGSKKTCVYGPFSADCRMRKRFSYQCRQKLTPRILPSIPNLTPNRGIVPVTCTAHTFTRLYHCCYRACTRVAERCGPPTGHSRGHVVHEIAVVPQSPIRLLLLLLCNVLRRER